MRRPRGPVSIPASVASAARAEAGASRALLYADDLTLGNLGLRDGGQVTIARRPAVSSSISSASSAAKPAREIWLGSLAISRGG